MVVALPLYIASSVEELASRHAEIEIDKAFSIYNYLSTCNNLVKQASIYKDEGDLEKEYIYSLRFCILTLEKLPKHPMYSAPEFLKARDKMKSQALKIVEELEPLKKILKKGYEEKNEKKRQEKIRIENEKEKERIFLMEKKKLEDEQNLLRQEEQKRLNQEKEFQGEIDKIREAQELSSRKVQVQKSMKQINTQRSYELLRQEAALVERARLDELKAAQLREERILQDKKDELDRNYKFELQRQQQIEQDRLDKEEKLRLASLPPPPINLDSDELLNYLDSNKLNNNNNNNNNDNDSNGDYLFDPSFLPPPPPLPIIEKVIEQPILPSPILPTINNNTSTTTTNSTFNQSYQPPSIPVNEKKLPPLYTSTSPVQFGYPSLNYNNPPPISLQSPPIQQVNTNNNTPFIQKYQQQTPPIQYNSQHQQQSPQYQPPPPQYNNNNNNKQPSLQLPQYQPIQQKPIIANGLPNNNNSNNNNIQSPPTTSTTVSKPNIDSPEASKKYNKLRKIIVHGEVFQEFMRLAENNTRKHIETCGILSGTLSNDVFRITTVIIPKQEGTTDTCNTIEEHEIFEYQLENDLLTLGWIHTHPTQDCFLSAVDVHTHCSYQYLLQEAIAVVISPMANPNFGIFRLTDPPGLETVQKCKLKSFHPHPPVNGVPIYTRVEHVDLIWGKKSDSKVIDLRFKK